MAPGSGFLSVFQLFFVISLCLATNWKEKVCTKESLQRFTMYKIDNMNHKLIPEERIKRRIDFVCCEGYRETSRNKEIPNCSPICKLSCGYGYCYAPNLCACYHGFELSGGICKIRRNILATTSTTSPASFDTVFEATTMPIASQPFSTDDFQRATTNSTQNQRFKNKRKTKQIKSTASSGSVNDFSSVKLITNGDSELRTTHSTSSIQHKDLEFVSSVEKTNFKQFSIDVTDYPRVKFITHNTDSDLETISPISLEDEVSKQLNNLKPSSKEVTDYPRVKIIPNDNSKVQTPLQRRRSNIPGNIETVRNSINIPKPYDFEKLAFCIMNICVCEFGYEVYQQKYCYPCQMGSQCQCQTGYAFNSRIYQCMPLCNGAFDGCVRGTCIEYNQCRCDNGTEKISNYENFHCYAEEGQKIFQNMYNIDKRWYLLLLLIPAVIVVVYICVIVKRSRSSAANRLRAQRHNFPEIRYFNTNNNLRVDNKHQEVAGRMHNDKRLCESVMQHDAGVLVITV